MSASGIQMKIHPDWPPASKTWQKKLAEEEARKRREQGPAPGTIDIRMSPDWVCDQLVRLAWRDPPAFFQLTQYARSLFRVPDDETLKKLMKIGFVDQNGQMPGKLDTIILEVMDEI